MKTIVISLLVATLSIATPTSPAKADTQEAAGLLAGIVAIGLLARAINDRNEADRAEAARPEVVTRNDAWRPHRVDPRAAQVQLLPETCLIDGPSRLDTALYDRRCLERSAARPGDLPDYCELKVRTDRGWQSAYGETCLMREGFRPEYRWARH